MTSATVAPPEVAEHTVAAPGRVATLVDRVAVGSSSRVAAFARPRLPLLAVLVVTTVLASRLMMVNTAFIDEATYLNAGHVIWHNWIHGGPRTHYPSFFSGAPDIYPVIAAFADDIGGLLLARILSLVFVLVAICAMHATARRLFDARTAAWAVVAFATVAGTQFLAAFATYDAMALMLMSLAVWVSVRYAQSDRVLPHAGVLLGAPILALANATKYATALYDPVVIAIVVLVLTSRYGWRPAGRRAVLFAAIVASLLAAGVAIGGPEYITGIASTTLNRAAGSTGSLVVFDHAERWVGVLSVMSAVAVAVAAFTAWRRRVWNVTTVCTLLLVTVLAVAVVLSPVEQARIHTTTSLQKHVTFGAWFAAIAVGSLLARISGGRFRAAWRWTPVLAAMIVLGLVGRQQAHGFFGGWPNTTTLTASLRPFVDSTNKPILMDDGDVEEYYLSKGTEPTVWTNTYYFRYIVPGSNRVLVGAAAYRSAILHDHFGLVALDFGQEAKIDSVIHSAIDANHHFHYVGRIAVHDAYGNSAYALWIDRHAELKPWV